MTNPHTILGRDPRTSRPLAVTIEDGIVVEIAPGPDSVSEWIAPGLIDLQINGFGGFDFNGGSPSAESVVAATRRLFAEGVTTYLPTLVTGSHEATVERLAAIALARTLDPLVADVIPFVHLEGPHISGQDGPRGVHDLDWVRAPTIAEFEDWQVQSGGLVGMVTMSPHYKNSADYIAALSQQGVHVAIGHTHADHRQITAAVDAGARLSTHLGNGAHTMLPRHPNYIWSQLADDRLTAGFIADGHHLPAETLTAMIKAKGLENSVLVSDAVALAGSKPGRYSTPVGGQVQLSDSGLLKHVDSGFLAGAARSLAYGVSHAATAANIGLAVALDLATVNPGRFVGGRGTLAVGERADLITFGWKPGDTRMHISSTVVAGELVSEGHR